MEKKESKARIKKKNGGDKKVKEREKCEKRRKKRKKERSEAFWF